MAEKAIVVQFEYSSSAVTRHRALASDDSSTTGAWSRNLQRTEVVRYGVATWVWLTVACARALTTRVAKAIAICSCKVSIMASLQMASSSRENLPEISSLPHQPTAFSFPKRSFGKKNVSLRSFQASWFRQWPFLHYDEARDVVHCHTCVMGFKEKKVKASNADPAFVSCPKVGNCCTCS